MNVKRLFSTFLVFLAVILTIPVVAQTNYSDVRVDDLTDAQIRQLIQRAESIGYSDAQLEQMAMAQGMKQTEIQKLRSRVDKIRKQDGGQGSSSNDNELNRSRSYQGQDTTRRGRNARSEKDSLGSSHNLIEDNPFEALKPKIFGADLFKNSDLTFEPNLRMATPKSYVIGPDDELLIDLSGDNEANYRLKVSPDGTIRLQYVGLISVGGLTIEQAISKVRSSMSGTYPGLRNGRTNVAITLGNIRSIKVTVVGEVVKPGSYTVPSLFTVFNLLYQSG